MATDGFDFKDSVRKRPENDKTKAKTFTSSSQSHAYYVTVLPNGTGFFTMTNNTQCFLQASAATSQPMSAASDAEISAVALLKLLMRAESAAPLIASPVADLPAETLALYDVVTSVETLSPYLEEQLQTIAEAVFNRVNGDFYRAFRGVSAQAPVEIVLNYEDLRPLAYRALMHQSDENEQPFAPRFAASLLLLQKYWHCDFLQRFKGVDGRLSAYSLKSGARKF